MAHREMNPDLRPVTIRLLLPDILAAKRIAKSVGLPYQTWLRERVHEIMQNYSRKKPVLR